MDEHVLAAVVRLNEAEALHVVVEFHRTHNHWGRPFIVSECTCALPRNEAGLRIVDFWRKSDRAPESETDHSSAKVDNGI
jgi:hypothetical protein